MDRKSAELAPATSERVEVHYSLHQQQREVFNGLTRFTHVAAGRKWGKTFLCTLLGLLRSAAKPGFYLWVAPTYQQAALGFRECKARWPAKAVSKIRESVPQGIELAIGSAWQFGSLDRPETLRGPNCDGVILDEAAYLKGDSWYGVIRPTLLARDGWATFIATPNGVNWWHGEWRKGLGATEGDTRSYQFPTSGNPYVPLAEIENARTNSPERWFRQEYLAEFIEEAGLVFRFVRECARLPGDGYREGHGFEIAKPRAEERYTVGVDLAKHHDFTVLVVLDSRKSMVYLERFSLLDWELQISRIDHVCRRYNAAEIWIDSTGVGDPIYERISRLGLPARPYQITAASKRALIDTLAMEFDRRSISLPRVEPLIDELVSYRYERTESGHLRMNAPEGKHDDFVIALALACFKPAPQSLVPLRTIPMVVPVPGSGRYGGDPFGLSGGSNDAFA